MKLVNPVGRNVGTFDVQANQSCGCLCSTTSLHSRAFAIGRGNDGINCWCQCSYGDANLTANSQGGYDKVH